MLDDNDILILVKDALSNTATYELASCFYDETKLAELEELLYADYSEAYEEGNDAGHYITVEDYLKAHISTVKLERDQ